MIHFDFFLNESVVKIMKSLINTISDSCYKYTLTNIDEQKREKLKSIINANFSSGNLKMNIYFSISKSILYPFTDVFLDLYHNELSDNNIPGENKYQRLSYFSNKLEESSWSRFHSNYPVFENTSKLIINETLNYLIKILDDLIKNKSEIESFLKVQIKELENIELSKGDTHSGKSVATIIFKKKNLQRKLFYKPHSNSTEKVFDNCLNFLQDGINIKFKYPESLGFKDHCWYKEIKYIETNDEKEIQNYYKRAGCMLSIFWLLGTTDIHSENIISQNGYPIIIDNETLSRGNNENGDFYSQSKSLFLSVMSTGMLPVSRSLKQDLDFDFNGIFPKKQIGKKVYSFNFVDDSKFDWIYETKPTIYDVKQSNVSSNTILPEEVANSFKLGFKMASEYIEKHSQKFIKIISVKYASRQLLRDTQVYADFILALQTPENLKSINKQEYVLNILKDAFIPSKFGISRLDDEIRSLKKWDIPYYYSFNGSRDLFNANNELVIKNFWSKTQLDIIKERIEKLNKSSISYQLRMIDLSLATYYDNQDLFKPDKNLKKHLIEKQAFINEVPNEYQKLTLGLFNPLPNNSRIENMYDLEFGRTTEITTITDGLYGSAGFILCLWRYSEQTKNEELSIKLKKHAIYLYSQLMGKYRNINDNLDNVKISVFSGIGGPLYVCSYLYFSTSEKEYIKDIQLLLKILDLKITSCNTRNLNFQYLNGLSGTLLLLNRLKEKNIFNVTILKYIEDIFQKISQISLSILLKSPDDLGIAHGLSGYLIGIVTLYNNGLQINPVFIKNNINKLVERLMHIRSFDSRWCRGDIGIIESLLILNQLNYKLISHDKIKKILDLNKNNFINSLSDYNNISACHGLAGLINVINDIRRNVINSNYNELLDNLYVPDISNLKIISSSDYHPTSFMLSTPGLIDSIFTIDKDLPIIVKLELPD